MSQTAANKQQLQDAFELFNQVSEQLTHSYAALQQQVVTLNQELAAARNERLQLLAEVRTLRHEASRRRRLSSMGEMTARLAHQVRTPLSTALLYASQLKQVNLPREQHDCFVDRLLVGLRHLDHMVNDMLVFARGGQGGEECVDVPSILEQVRQSLHPRLEACRARWQLTPGSGPLQVQGQAEVLASVLGNLANNALDACGDGAQLEWRVHAQASDLIIVLQDNGPGVAGDLREDIFEPFFTTRSNGTGLGLAVVRAVLAAHQGDIELDADFQGGARFVIRLPLYRVPQHLPSERLKSQQKAAITSSRYV
jgi:two-component system sensor histidine kinase FlrB